MPQQPSGWGRGHWDQEEVRRRALPPSDFSWGSPFSAKQSQRHFALGVFLPTFSFAIKTNQRAEIEYLLNKIKIKKKNEEVRMKEKGNKREIV
jgi:hypothetical protein